MSASKAVSAVPERPAVMGRYKPYWTETPDSDDMSSFYPAHAQRHDINGRVTLRCQVGPDGRLNACQVRAEAPQGEGFGAAALSLAEKFRMLPPDIPAGHAPPEITIPIVFEIPNYNRLTKDARAEAVDGKAPSRTLVEIGNLFRVGIVSEEASPQTIATPKVGASAQAVFAMAAVALIVLTLMVIGLGRRRKPPSPKP